MYIPSGTAVTATVGRKALGIQACDTGVVFENGTGDEVFVIWADGEMTRFDAGDLSWTEQDTEIRMKQLYDHLNRGNREL